MLVISRRPQESIRIGETVVTITRVQGQTVRLGIEAPRDVPIVRCELPTKSPPPVVEPSSDEQGAKRDAA